jgi:copper chaperone CopZ
MPETSFISILLKGFEAVLGQTSARCVDMVKMTFKVRGMHCPSCEKLLQMEIGDIPGVASVKADWKSGTITVEGESFHSDAVKKAIVDNGYKV